MLLTVLLWLSIPNSFLKRLKTSLVLQNIIDIFFGCRSLSINAWFFITSIPWKRFFRQHIQSPAITTFDASHCYWLLADDLIHSVIQMINLEQLNINDTKISLMHLPNIFATCHKVVKLSFTLIEKNLDGYLSRMCNGKNHTGQDGERLSAVDPLERYLPLLGVMVMVSINGLSYLGC